jgi:hypothetical protein
VRANLCWRQLTLCAVSLIFSTPAAAVLIASDNASDAAYSGGWNNGTNGGTGFGAWELSQSDNGGFFRFTSTELAGGNTGADIDVAGMSFGLYGKNDGDLSFDTADAVRNFGAPLATGSTFSISIAVNYRNGNKGIDLRGSSGSTLFNFNVGSDDYAVNAAASGNGSIGSAYGANTSFRLTFTQDSPTEGTWEILREGSVTDVDSGTYNGLAAGFKLYVNGTDGSNENNFYANSMSISAIPEPTAALFGGLLTAAVSAGLTRRGQRQN